MSIEMIFSMIKTRKKQKKCGSLIEKDYIKTDIPLKNSQNCSKIA
jgi:hypothetical protein